jgi:hypothetical protein
MDNNQNEMDQTLSGTEIQSYVKYMIDKQNSNITGARHFSLNLVRYLSANVTKISQFHELQQNPPAPQTLSHTDLTQTTNFAKQPCLIFDSRTGHKPQALSDTTFDRALLLL